jgi:phosphopantetheinyl transferase (holo-ACP synthase)
MGLFYQFQNNKYSLLVWKIEESWDEISDMHQLKKPDYDAIMSIKSEKRRIEKVLTRYLTAKLLNKDPLIDYTDTGKPVLNNSSKKISISHTNGFVGVMISDEFEVGLDLELLTERIFRIKHKFMSDTELKVIDEKKEMLHLYLHWCAKECLVKVFDNKSFIFDKDLLVEPFIPELEGAFKVLTNLKNKKELNDIQYVQKEEMVIVWTNTL